MEVDRETARTYTLASVDGQRLTVHGVLSSRGIFMLIAARPTFRSSTLLRSGAKGLTCIELDLERQVRTSPALQWHRSTLHQKDNVAQDGRL